MEFLNKYTLVYSEICFNKNLYQTETIFAKQINWQLTGFYMIQFFFLKSTSEQTLVLSKTLLNLLWNLPNVSLNWNSISSSFFVYILKNPKQIYYSLKTYWYFYKPYIITKQTGLTNWFVIPQKNFCSCIQKTKNKHCSADVFFFISMCYL